MDQGSIATQIQAASTARVGARPAPRTTGTTCDERAPGMSIIPRCRRIGRISSGDVKDTTNARMTIVNCAKTVTTVGSPRWLRQRLACSCSAGGQAARDLASLAS